VNVLITGASSLVGWALLRKAPPEWDVTLGIHSNPDLPACDTRYRTVAVDITDRASVERLVEQARPDAVIHMGSQGNLEKCKADPEGARRVNVDGTRYLLEASARFDPLFLLTSTMYVFSGEHPPYREDAVPHPINEYGEMKLEAERLVQTISRRWVIIRPMTIFGWHSPRQRANWVTWLLGRFERNEPTHVVNDVISNQLWVGDAADSIISAVRDGCTGIFHIGGSESVSRYEFSVKVAEVFGYSKDLLIPVTSDYFPQLAHRPGSAVCNVDKMTDVLGVKPRGVREGLERMKALRPGAVT
jgi:dTDP-4-dehydrorhamnose reductase